MRQVFSDMKVPELMRVLEDFDIHASFDDVRTNNVEGVLWFESWNEVQRHFYDQFAEIFQVGNEIMWYVDIDAYIRDLNIAGDIQGYAIRDKGYVLGYVVIRAYEICPR